MKRIDSKSVRKYFDAAAEAAKDATCERARCGAVIVSNDQIIGRGYNAPPLDDESQRMCDKTFDTNKKPKYDLTCCVHAEWNAVFDACKHHANKLPGSTLYFMRIDSDGHFTNAG